MSKEEKAQQKRRCYLCRERGHMAYSCSLVWVPSKRGWMCVGTKGIGDLIQMKFILLISWLNQEIETYCIHQTLMSWQVNEVKSAFNIQMQLSSCGGFIGHIWWLANIWVDSCFWMIMSYQGMIMCRSISVGCIWVDWIGNIHILLAMRCLNGLNVWVIMFGLICIG